METNRKQLNATIMFDLQHAKWGQGGGWISNLGHV
jgi:hypothetical protein